jgi:hypothetical protein
MTQNKNTTQSDQVRMTRKMLEYDMRAAAAAASKLGRPLTDAEFETYRYRSGISITPIKRLTFDGVKYSAV